jgi:LmbE family N-acetylglucosaminyl deacetylase
MLTDHERLAARVGRPRLVRLHRALARLGSVLTFVNSGAHPDDEHSALIAALGFGLGMRTVVLCSTRGEGGQNGLGPERGAALAALRTREMEVAAARLDADVVWVGHGPDDPVHDFGFSKNGDDTLRRWGEARLFERMVRAFRTVRPDIVLPTFLDVPGQHGHHRAMTRSALAAFRAAGDPAVHPEHLAEGLTPWQPAKFYLPAWSGAGNAYDDEVPPPPATLTVTLPAFDPATGLTWSQLGEWSRAGHASQGMGRWVDPAPRNWALHLAERADGPVGPEADIRAGLAATLADLAADAGLPPDAAMALAEAASAVARARAAFPDGEAVAEACGAIHAAVAAAHGALDDDADARIGHRLRRKLRELDVASVIAAGVSATARAEGRLVPGGSVDIAVTVAAPAETAVTVDLALRADLSLAGRNTVDGTTRLTVTAPADVAPTRPYPPSFSGLGGNGPAAVRLSATIAGRPVAVDLDLEEPLDIGPATSLSLDPEAVIVDPARPEPVTVAVTVDGPGAAGFALPEGWTATPVAGGARLTPPAVLAAGVTRIPATVDGAPAFRRSLIAYRHVGRVPFLVPQAVAVLAADVRRPAGTRIGYLGGGNDRVGLWLARLGLDVTPLDAAAFAEADLSTFTTLVVGIMAFGTRADLRAGAGRLAAFVEAGGHLVTLYHRPSDGWAPATVPPRFLEIGLPSLRWRVTDPAAPVTFLVPDHPLLAGPNRITAADFDGWDKERGLYFAARWDEAYQPLLALSDAGEAPLTGALLSARIGAGRHTHTSLVLHHQLDRLVPGAFRLLANLVQPA